MTANDTGYGAPSPESLRPRAKEYWHLLVSGDRAGASLIMRPEDRPAFLQGQEQPFRDPVVETIELSGDGAQATLGIAFDMMTPHRRLPLEDPAGMDRRGRRMDGRTPRNLRQPLPPGPSQSRIRT